MHDHSSILVSMNQLSLERSAQIVRCLVEGNSIRATVRMTKAAKNTVVKLLAELGAVCAAYQDEHLVNLNSSTVQCDEIWSFVGMKEKNKPEDKLSEFGYGDVWTWTAIDADSKLMICWHIGMRDIYSAKPFMKDVASRLKNRIQLTTDGHRIYLTAVREAFGKDIDYAMLVKIYANDPTHERMYSPSICIEARKVPICGEPDTAKVSTSYVERQNLTMRMQMRRFTRLTNGFSKKLENHSAAISLHFMHYNYCRVHQTLKTTPAVAAGITDHTWTVEEVISLLNRSATNVHIKTSTSGSNSN